MFDSLSLSTFPIRCIHRGPWRRRARRVATRHTRCTDEPEGSDRDIVQRKVLHGLCQNLPAAERPRFDGKYEQRALPVAPPPAHLGFSGGAFCHSLCAYDSLHQPAPIARDRAHTKCRESQSACVTWAYVVRTSRSTFRSLRSNCCRLTTMSRGAIESLSDAELPSCRSSPGNLPPVVFFAPRVSRALSSGIGARHEHEWSLLAGRPTSIWVRLSSYSPEFAPRAGARYESARPERSSSFACGPTS